MSDEQEVIAGDHGYCSFSKFSLSFEAMRRESSAFLTFLLDRLSSKEEFSRALMKSSTSDVETVL